MLAGLILALHLTVVLFNVGGLIVIPLGAVRGWGFVHAPVWRILHAASWTAVAVQAVLGRACFLTLWQAAAEGSGGAPEPLVMHLVNAILYWPLPLWVFSVLYLLAFGCVLLLLRLVPIRCRLAR
jgi:uncharacterized protein DUF2784